MTSTHGSTTAAIVLAGGRATRFDGVDKMAVEVDGVPMLTTVLSSAHAAGCAPVLVLGPTRESLVPAESGDTIRWIPDTIGGAGPAAAIAPGVAALGDPGPGLVLLLAGDLPFLTGDALRELRARLFAAPAEVDGAVAVDGEGRSQWLLSAWRTAALRRRLEAHGAAPGSSLHALLAPLRVEQWRARARNGHEPWRDVDDPGDVRG